MLYQMIFIIIFFVSPTLFAQESTLAMDLQNVKLQDALHILAKELHKNVIISAKVHGITSLHLKDMTKQEAWESLLTSQHLKEKKVGNTWYVASQAELLQRQQEETKLKISAEESAPLLTRLWQIHYANAADIAKLLQDSNYSLLSKRGQVKSDYRTNMLCIQDTAVNLYELDQLIKKLDIPVQQVLIETRLASIDNDCERELGINFLIKEPKLNVDKNKQSFAKKYSIAIAQLANSAQLDIQLAALEREGHGELISSPSLFTANQQTASIESGEEIPYQEVSESGGTAVAFKKAVISLKVTPQILPDDKVLLQLQINQDRPSNRIVLGVPAINTRQINTNVLVKNEQTIVLGGIYESNQEQTEQRIPFFGKIPLIGWLFKQENTIKNKRELLIFVTPKIISQTGLT